MAVMLQDGRKDHPRSRGEYRARKAKPRTPQGSSPLSRGIPCHVITAVAANGIIPALAGNTSYSAFAVRKYTDHPRSRGEYVTTGAAEESGIGSSPLSRGILVQFHQVFYALWDHPRSRGEYIFSVQLGARRCGSSPLSRGILLRVVMGPSPPGIIPALAGNT